MAKGNFNKKHDPAIVWPQIFRSISEGKSLASALKQLNPSPSTWWAKQQIRNSPELQKQYEEATQLRADTLVDELLDMVNAEMPEGLDGPSKSAWVQHLRVKCDTFKWAACKFHPRMFGDRMAVDVTSTQISITAALTDANKRLANHSSVVDGEVVSVKLPVVCAS